MNDEQYMAEALALASRAAGYTHPNPMVGAVVVKEGRIIGRGYHHRAGEAHAEVHALAEAGEAAKGATLYVTLEPCAHYGKTPPCANRVVDAGITRVVIGIVDPNPLVAGKGVNILRQAGIAVTIGVLAHDCARLTEGFIAYIKTGQPFITLKSAMSLDGKIATRTGDSQWITGEAARKDGHRLRASHDAILTGIGTVLADNPKLDCRLSGEDWPYEVPPHQPDVIILDSKGRTPDDALLWQGPSRKVILFVTKDCSKARQAELTALGAIVHEVPAGLNGVGVDLQAVLVSLGGAGYTSVLVEGGSGVIASFVEQRLFDKIVTYIGNILIGGETALGAVGGQGAATLAEAVPLQFETPTIVGDTIRVEGYYRERKGAYVYGDC